MTPASSSGVTTSKRRCRNNTLKVAPGTGDAGTSMRIRVFASAALLRAWRCAYVGSPAQASALPASAASTVGGNVSVAEEDAAAAVALTLTLTLVPADGDATAADGDGFATAELDS